MAKNQNQQPNKTASGTNIQQVKQQNAQAGQYGTEFAGETNAQEVKQQNQQAEAQKNQNNQNNQNNQQY
ncbi:MULTISPECIES: gamma-type small acid-soluble spore protein [Bacillaceae]|uniref:gamma-type small acid-soluble spore protein n=1 Tax=Bacillaceae TaxID=186817 RepID=UPI001BDEB885|nr:gamma-type small acid-soluble spore protein [Cytobacillus sp. IB215316]MDX8362346.1 gamma-type small acid-soluble spore protein [Cytobacillus sp. IB215316]